MVRGSAIIAIADPLTMSAGELAVVGNASEEGYP